MMVRKLDCLFLGTAILTANLVVLSGCVDGQAPNGPLPYNFSVLETGRAYRSSQPTTEELGTIIDTYGVRTVINLRGPNPGDAWYDSELALCQERGVQLVDYSMSAKSLPSAEVLAGIIDTLQTTEYPILIHCQGGSDRTGAISAIYRMAILGQSRSAALAELSILHLHLRDYAPCMDTLAELYEPTQEWLDWYAANRDQITCR